jgi:DNA polymerase-3 subunit gamma/tau
MSKQFSLSRPKTLDKMVGQEALAHLIRKRVKKDIPKAWLFYGETGLGKTTMARIVALSIQCDLNKFGSPCKDCQRKRSIMPIYKLNASDKTGVDDLRDFIDGASYNVLGSGKQKVFIFEEAHQMSKAGQNLLLDHLEDTSNSAVWMICSTEPRKLLKTLRRRCFKCQLLPLDTDAITKYVTRLLKPYPERSVEDFVDALTIEGIDSPGIIAQAAELYVAGMSAEKAAKSEQASEIDTKELCLAVTKGDWPQVCTLLYKYPNSDARGLRASIVGWLRKQLLETTEFNKRNKVLADCMKRMCYMHFPDDLIVMSALAAELYTVTELFSEYKR